MNTTSNSAPMHDDQGFFGPYGDHLVTPHLKQAMDDINPVYAQIAQRQNFQGELVELFANYVRRPSPIFHTKRRSALLGDAQIHLKREDLNHTDAQARTKTTTVWENHCWPNS